VVLVLLVWSWSCKQRSWSCYVGLGLNNLVLFTSLIRTIFWARGCLTSNKPFSFNFVPIWIKIRNQGFLKRNFYHCRIRTVIEFWRDWLPWRRLTITEYFLSIIRCPVESDKCEYSDRKSSSKSAEAFYYGRQRKKNYKRWAVWASLVSDQPVDTVASRHPSSHSPPIDRRRRRGSAVGRQRPPRSRLREIEARLVACASGRR